MITIKYNSVPKTILLKLLFPCFCISFSLSSFCCAALLGRCVLEISVQPLWGGLQLFVPLLVIILCLLLVCAYLFRSLQALRKNQHQQDTLIMLNQRQSWREKDDDAITKNQETSEDENGPALLSVQVQWKLLDTTKAQSKIPTLLYSPWQKNRVRRHSKVKSLQSEVPKGASTLVILITQNWSQGINNPLDPSGV